MAIINSYIYIPKAWEIPGVLVQYLGTVEVQEEREQHFRSVCGIRRGRYHSADQSALL